MYCDECNNSNAIINGYWVCLNCSSYSQETTLTNFHLLNYINILRFCYALCSFLLILSVTNLCINFLQPNKDSPVINIFNSSKSSSQDYSNFPTINQTLPQQLPQKNYSFPTKY